MPAPASRRGASPALCPTKGPRHLLRSPLPTPSVANCGESPTVSCGVLREPRHFWNRGASGTLSTPPMWRVRALAPCGDADFPAIPLPGVGCVQQVSWACSPWASASPPHYRPAARRCQPDPLLAPPGVVWQFPPRLRDFIFFAPCCRSSVVEHPLGKGEVECSIHSGSTRKIPEIQSFQRR
jgi:hypothetical protein